MSQFRADLHCHSTCSDGSLSPEELVHMAIEIGLSALSITDHDCIEAYKQAAPLAKKLGLELLNGVEFSSVLDGVSVHVLGYGFSLDDAYIQELCEKHALRRGKRNKKILDLLAEHGMPISEEELAKVASTADQTKNAIGRPHIAQCMVNKGYVKDIKEAFKKYISDGSSCFAMGEPISTQETIDIIHKANGVAIIAHPHLISDSKTLLKLLKMNFDGIECYYSKFSLSENERWLKIAHNKKWLITGGSDFHGSVKPLIPLGCSWIPEENYTALRAQ